MAHRLFLALAVLVCSLAHFSLSSPLNHSLTLHSKREDGSKNGKFLNIADFQAYHGWDVTEKCDQYYTDEVTTIDGTDYPKGKPSSKEGFPSCRVAMDDRWHWLAVTYDDGGFMKANYVWAEDDARVANCLINLHYVQNTKCISVKGSVCEAIKGTSHILNSVANNENYHLHWPGKNHHQISGFDSGMIQEATKALIGQKVNSHGGNGVGVASGVYFENIAMPDTGPKDCMCTQAEVSIVFEGAREC